MRPGRTLPAGIATSQPRFRAGGACKSPPRPVQLRSASKRRARDVSRHRLSPLEGDMVAESLFRRSWPSAATAAFAILALTVVLAAPAGATPRPVPTLTSTDAMLKWINAYRGRPEPDGLP